MTRQEKSAEATALHKSGLTWQEVADEMGISRSYAYDLVRDPDYSKVRARKSSYRGTCEECGGPTDGSNGRAKAPRFCQGCVGDARAFWTKDTIVQAIQEYNSRFGRRPSAWDWSPALARARAHPERLAEIEERWQDGVWPSMTHVQGRFGSWNAAIEAAGFEPNTLGHRTDPERWRRNLRDGARGPHYSNDTLLEAIQRYAELLGRTPSVPSWIRDTQHLSWLPSSATIVKRFGSWNAAMKAAGLKPNPCHSRGEKKVAA